MTAKESDMDRLSLKLAAEQASQPAGHFDYRSIASELDGLIQPILDAIGTTKAKDLQTFEKGLPHVLALTAVISSAPWHSIRFLCWERPEVGWQRDFIYSVPPLARTLLDSLFNLMFMFDNPKDNVHWFLAGGWCDQQRAYNRFKEKYGKKDAWQTWFAASSVDIKQTEDHLVDITDAERKRPDRPLKGFWPNPGQMGGKQHPIRDQSRARFLKYTNDWFYKELSGDSHLSLTGLLNRGGHHLPLAAGVDPDDLYKLTRSKFAGTALTIYVALLSEISVELSLAQEKATLSTIWKNLELWPDAADLHKERYERLLA
jgi:hypothetical protein